MLKRILIPTFLFLLLSLSSNAQTGREWIVSGQSYYKIPVLEEGVYAVPFTQLNSAGISTGAPEKLQVWFRGVEQSVAIANNTLYFQGKGNDGTLDSLLYEPASSQPNKYYSLFSDTAYYFLTIGTNDGKRLNSTASSPVLTNNYHTRVVTQFFVDDYSRGALYFGETLLSTGDVAEGWFGTRIYQAGETPEIRTYEIPVANVSPASSTVSLEVLFAGLNNNAHRLEILIGSSSSSPDATYVVDDFSARSMMRFKQNIPVSLLTSNQTLKVHIKVKGTSTGSGPNIVYNPDMVAVAHMILTYPEVANASGKTYDVLQPVNDNSDKTLTIAGFTDGSFLWDVTNEGNYTNLPYTYSSGTATVDLAGGVKKVLYASAFKNILGIRNVNMTPYTGGAEMLVITHYKLMDGVNRYVAHRSSPFGGSLNISVAEINRLYDLYSYGEKHPIAIKRYCAEQLALSSNPKYLFIIGKGVHLDYSGITDQGNFYYRKNPNAFINNTYVYQQLNYRMEDLIPTYGVPSSDLYFSMTDASLRPKLATGRLSARTNNDIDQYLEKVKKHQDAGSSSLWRKNLIHLSGGKTTNEIDSFRNVVDGWKTYAEAPRFGGKVTRTFQKSLEAGSVDDKLISSISEEVNKGVSYVTFFGHSSPSIIDLDIGNVSNPVYGYSNKGKYPVLIINGCQSAEFFSQGSIPEDWIMTPEKGAVLAMGHGDIGYPHLMNAYTTHFYHLNFNDTRYIDKTIGEIYNKTIDTFLTTLYPTPAALLNINPLELAQATQYNLQGDPALKTYKPLLTDYAVAGDNETGEKKAFIKAMNGDPITAMSDSFAIGLPIINYGLSSNQPISIKIRHTVTNNNVVVVDDTYPLRTINPIGYCDTVYLWIHAENAKYFGINRFEVTVDPRDSIEEFDEMNNVATLEYFFPLASVSCLYPQEYSVVYNQPVTFIAQSIDLFQTEKDYYVEIDTTHLFNSASKIIKTIHAGATVKFTQNLLTDLSPSDSLVYYWRIRFSEQTAEEDTIWGESSFIYIKNSPPGWSQSEPAQFYKDRFHQLELNASGNFAFVQDTSILYVRTKGNLNGDGGQNVEVGVNNNGLVNLVPAPGFNNLFDGPNGRGGGMYVVVFDGESALPYAATADPDHLAGIYGDPRMQQFPYLHNSAWQDKLIAFLHSIKINEYVLILSGASMTPSNFTTELKTLLHDEFGARHIDDLTDSSPYILLARKKLGTTALEEVFTTDEDSTIVLNYNLPGQFKSGSATSTLIGPASSWGTFYKTVKTEASDQTSLKIIRINNNGKEIDTIAVPLAGDIDLNPLVDANTYPYIKLLFSTTDTFDLTPSYLKKWQVIYAPTPEGTLDPVAAGVSNYTNIPLKLNGETFQLPFVFENISEVDFPEPLKTVFTLRDERGNVKRDTLTIGLLPKGHDTTFYYTVNTTNSFGKNVLQVYVNPRLQREVYYQNNLLEIPFNVQIDKVHPVLGVMFDGVHIFDGDLVSPRPHISAVLIDDNNLVTLTDTSTIEVILEYPGQNLTQQIFKNSPGVISWGPDPQKKGKFTIEYMPPQDFADGKYKLTVKGRDATGNRSSAQNIEVNFEVINASTITNFYPYPNPFSTSCRFVFTLTGKEVPEDLKIQIMTVSGKVVKEIFKHDLGAIHVGDNVSDYAWDGRDEFGDKLANGVYIYRVIIKNQNDNFQHRETSGDKAFKKGYGKLYILR